MQIYTFALIDNLPFYTIDEDNMQNAYNSPLLVFIEKIEKVNFKTGEIYYINKRKYLNLTFSFKIDSQEKLQELTVRGSVHKFYNGGLHNANTMSFNDFKTTLDKYVSLFGLDLTKCELLPFEYGTNLYLNEFSNYNIDNIILNTYCVKRKMFNCNAGIDTSLISGTSKTEVRIKFYSKSAEYPKYCNNTLRIEDKLTKTRGVTSKGINYVSDLYDIKNHKILLEKHLENISNIVLYDYTMKIPKNSKYLTLSKKYRNPIFWKKLIRNCKNGKEYNTKYNEEVGKLNSMSKKYGSNILQILLQQTKNQSLKGLNL
ncbi:hypothetical protein [Tenacibaculum maritimum]|uniref:hypothetical protein n=1 Tax=Tenacibaculum maritimum TaxID=107401 RepID=UPI00387639E6